MTHAAQPTEAQTVDALAQEIRRVDGNHNLGAGALAEALMPFVAALSLSQPSKALVEVKTGWQLVPVKPTMEMIQNAAADHEGEAWLPASLWASMLAAAPTSEPGTRGPTLAETDAANAEAGALAIQAIIGEPDTQGPEPIGYCVWISPTKLAACTKKTPSSFPVYDKPTAQNVDAGEVIEALEKIACFTQTTGLLWWQVEARNALAALRTPPATDGPEDGR